MMPKLNRWNEILSGVELSHITMYVWLLAGKFWVVYTGDVPLPGQPDWVKTAWIIVGFLCPTMIFVGYWLIYHRPGRARYFGMWMRLGADIGQECIMIIFMMGLLTEAFGMDMYRHHVFTAFFIGALLTFVASMILRDVLAIIGTERLAWKLRARE